MTAHKTRTWGFQFSPTDGAAIGIFAGVAVVLWKLGSPLWWMLVIAAVHFFLFCNVFRIVRRRGLIWAGLFIFNNGIWMWFDDLTWTRVMLCQLPITAGLIFTDMRTPRYHGIFAKRMNPRLNDYLEGKIK